MNYKIDHVEVLSLGAQARTVMVRGLSFLLQNGSDSAEVYFKEARDDGEAATPQNAYVLGPGRETLFPLTARELSLAAQAEGTPVRVLILDQE